MPWRRNGRSFRTPDKAYAYDDARLKKQWARLHKGDVEPLPKDADVLAAWRHFHAGEFRDAVDAGIAAGGAGINAAVKAQVVYANYLEKAEKAKLELLEEAAGWPTSAAAPRRRTPTRITSTRSRSAATARASRWPRRWRRATAARSRKRCSPRIKLEPKHADAHTAYGAYQAEVIDKVGGIVAGMTYGAKKDSAVEHYEKALKLFPESPIAHIEYANGLLMLFGKGRIAEATKLYEKAAATTPARRDGAARRRAREVGAGIAAPAPQADVRCGGRPPGPD